jgi:DnaK suppressor protein
MDESTLARLRGMLESRRAALASEHEAARHATEVHSGIVGPRTEVGDQADEARIDTEVAFSIARAAHRDHEMSRVAAALTRVESGDYGLCVDCGIDIPVARLEIDPAAERCTPCQTRAERVRAMTGRSS